MSAGQVLGRLGLAAGDEQRGGGHADIGGVPDPRGIDDRLTGADRSRAYGAIDLLEEGDGASRAQNQLLAVWVHLPRVPGLTEGVHGHEAPFGSITYISLGVSLVPVHIARESLLACHCRPEAEVHGDLCEEETLIVAHGCQFWHGMEQQEPPSRERGIVRCQTVSEYYDRAYYGFSLGGCTDPANTGGPGQGSVISAGPTSQTVLITWAAGGTTTISVTITQATYRVRDCGPQMSESEVQLTGQVTSDTTGSIKLKSVKAKVCVHSWRALATLNNVARIPFKL
jgi:hypothetical protein